jgi:hypothetical protein
VRPGARITDRDDVDVAVEGQRTPDARSRKLRGDNGVAGRLLPTLDLGAQIGEPGGDCLLAASRLSREFRVVFRLAVGPARD